jgi:hypothetical protein
MEQEVRLIPLKRIDKEKYRIVPIKQKSRKMTVLYYVNLLRTSGGGSLGCMPTIRSTTAFADIVTD